AIRASFSIAAVRDWSYLCGFFHAPDMEIGGVEGRVEEFLVVEFGFGEGNGEFVAVRLLALVLGDVAGAVRLLARAALLPFEANLLP
ncbi:MAG: hypothetical protein ACRD4O_01895, partial [Bryobacteraceae bacterium]